jgi:predicted lipid carrier protein YhbT/chorismate mutase
MAARPLSLVLARGLIDGVDDMLVALLAGRARLVDGAAIAKRRAGLPPRDALREAAVHARAQRLAARLGLCPATARTVLEAAIREAHQRQLRASGRQPRRCWLAPAKRVARMLRLLPQAMQHRALESAMARVLGGALAAGDLEFLRGRRLGIDVTDLGLHWVIGIEDDRLVHAAGPPEASVRGTTTDLLLLAGRLEDADTLFFQRRLELTGDTELGLSARNVLDGLRWESVPLGLRIALERGARLARAARAARGA